jgi:hypothetical protein
MKTLLMAIMWGSLLVSCEFWQDFKTLEVRWAEGPEGITRYRPLGQAVVYTERGIERNSWTWGEVQRCSIARLGSGFILWQIEGGEPQGAVWTSPTEEFVYLNNIDGWLAQALDACVRQGAPVNRWDLVLMREAIVRKFGDKAPVFWNNHEFAGFVLAGNEGAAGIKPRPTRTVVVPFVEGAWYPLHSGLPELTQGLWPLGTWKWVGPQGELWVHVPEEGPVLVKIKSPPIPLEDDVDEFVGNNDDPLGG